ncbi:oligosaccharide flippase family protein [Guptibacillus hwajinpoensis]|uniref:oligosaccharide flippase family protein n=1 Tax=Guptibacillus hwajinpoensis TaxID=208199 RepID=UPI001CFE68C7|nr:oligosaccharide flippase family protein [Pseudalkalibacillus hwajinpoensis]WLR61563.1 oligosaccharide flippase family protein [Pseudalkalibacillus hwajinpoensis]
MDKITRNILARNTVWMMVGQGLRLVTQSAYFVLIARALGKEGFGAFSAVLALVAILIPFSGIGSGNLLIKNVSRDTKKFSVYWGNALFMVLTTGLILVGTTILSYTIFLPNSISIFLVLFIALSDILFMKFIEISGQAFIAFEKMKWTAIFQLSVSFARLIAGFIVILVYSTPTPLTWSIYYLSSTLLIAVLSIVITCKKISYPKKDLSKIIPELKEGLYFSIGLSSQSVYNEIDKTMLAKISSLGSAGIYAAAYRLIDVGFTPIKALLAASYSKYFQYGSRGIKGTLELTKKILPLSTGITLILSIILYFGAPFAPLVLGNDYEDAVIVIKLLAILPLLKTVHYFAADTLTGAGYQGTRSLVQILIAMLNVILNLILIPEYSLWGAAIASIISDGLLGISLWLIIVIKLKK